MKNTSRLYPILPIILLQLSCKYCNCWSLPTPNQPVKRKLTQPRITPEIKNPKRRLPLLSAVTSDANDGEWSIRRRMGVTAALFSSGLTIIAAKCTLPATMALLTSSSDTTSGLLLPTTWSNTRSGLMSELLTFSTLAIAIGKSFLGPLIDIYGGVPSLQLALLLTAGCLALISQTNSFLVFSGCWILVDLTFSASWPACLNTVHRFFPEKDWPRKIAMMGAASRTGNTVAFAAFASLLHWTRFRAQNWRFVFLISSLAQVVPLTLLSIYGREKRTDPTLPEVSSTTHSPKKPLAVLRKQAKTLDFWLHLCSRSSLMIYGSFLLFVPTFMTQCYGMSSASASRVASIFALGCLTSLTAAGSKIYSSPSSSKSVQSSSRLRLIQCLLGLAIFSSLCNLAHVSNVIEITPSMASFIMYTWGFSFSIPYYIPPSLYALRQKSSSATIIDIFDLVGFGLLALFNRYVARISHQVAANSAWIPVFVVLTLCACTSWVSLSVAFGRERRADMT